MSSTIRVEHLARVEGHGGVTVELENGALRRVQFDIFEGARLLEAIVRGRSYEDISQTLSRICAICSVAHALTSLKATEDAFGVRISPQTELLRDLLYRGESIESHALHIFCLAAPDYLGYPSVLAMAADHGEAVKLGLRLKKLGNTIQEVIGGRAVHPVNAVLGGFGKLPAEDQLIALRDDLRRALADCQTVVGLVASLPPADFCRARTVFAALSPPGNYGYYSGDEIVVVADGRRVTVPAADYRSLTNERAVPHSHAKHSLYRGQPFMVGALARLAVNAGKLSRHAADAMALMKLSPPSENPMDNNKAQAVELIFDIEQALETVERLLGGGLKDEDRAPVVPRAGVGTAVTEAPRGLLFHSYTYDEQGRIVSADVITPTALNAASVERHLRSTVEQSAETDEPALRRKLEMIVRAYDPCISCSVH
jgi:sulfhydrogenase subunit alpha